MPLYNTVDDPVAKPEPPQPESERDSVYYFDTIVFKVENTLFRVPKNGFQLQDSFFETALSLPQPKGKIVEGSDDACPLPLLGISKAYFRGFLRVLYPFYGTATTYEEWLGALDLATMWDFKEIRKASVEALSPLIKSRDAVENTALAKKYRVKRWLLDGYLKIIQEAELLNIDKLRSSNLDLLTIARLWSIYGTILANRAKSGKYCGYCGRIAISNLPKITPDEANPQITQIFTDELMEMETF